MVKMEVLPRGTRKFGLQRLEPGRVRAKGEVIVDSSAQTRERAVFSFLNEWVGEASELIGESCIYYITEVLDSQSNEVVMSRKFDLTQWHGFGNRAPVRFSFPQFVELE